METDDGVVMDVQETKTHTFSKNKIIALGMIAAVTIFVGGFVVGKIYQVNVDVESVGIENDSLTKSDQEQGRYNDSDRSTWALPQRNEEGVESDDSFNNETDEIVRLPISGHILTIKDGDVWQIDANGENTVKLIDLDIVTNVSRSDSGNNIAYVLEEQIDKKVEWHDGSQKDAKVWHKKLYLADNRGANSQLIHDGIVRWGWMPDSESLWYEKSSSEVIGGGMFPHSLGSTGEVWVFDLGTQRSTKMDSNLARGTWSPDGEKKMFTSDSALHVFDTRTLSTQKLFTLPYVGGNRGGPQPIPYFEWSPDSEFIYTVFTPFINGERTNTEINLKTKHMAALKIPINGGKIERVAPEVPSEISNRESYPRAHFSSDFTKVFYPRVNSLEYSDNMRTEGGVNLVMYDTETNQEIVLLENPGKPERGLMQYGVPLTWVVDEHVYILKGDGDWLDNNATLSFIKKNYITGETEILAAIDNRSGNVWDIHFDAETESVYFTSNKQLIRLNQQGSTVIADGVGLGGAKYYFE